MRLCLLAHGFPPHERAGVENYTAGLAAAFARAGHRVAVFAPRVRPDLPDLSLRREARDGYEITWLNVLRAPKDPVEALDPPQLAQRFGEWLDVERPEVVHVQHLVKLGLGFAEAAAERGMAVVYTAHDYYPICHRFTLLKPDLSRCEQVGDPQLCSRCDLGLSLLNRVAGLGDYHMGVPASQLAPKEARALAAVLAGETAGSGLGKGEWKQAAKRRAALDQRRAEVFRSLDLWIAPTEYLAERLVAGGLDRAKLRVLGYGIDTGGLAERRRDVRPRRPLRLGYVGSVTKHKGVHVLLEAFGQLAAPAELHIHGDSTDRVYTEQVQRRARQLGAKWHGPYDGRDLGRVLAHLDVVVVPSLWVENQPLVIREAFAAGRPVVASDLGALPQSVRDGVDGLLFPPGDSAALARVLARLVDEPKLYERLVGGIGPVKDADAQVRELLPLYREALAAAKARRADPTATLPHLREVAQRYGELKAMPLDQLFGDVLRGLEKLAPLIGAQDEPWHERVQLALGGASRARDSLCDVRAERVWLAEQLAGREREAEAARAEAAWRAQELEAKGREMTWLLERAKNAEAGLESRAEEARWRDGEIETLRKEVAYLRGELSAAEAEKARERLWLDGELQAAKEKHTWLAEQQAGEAERARWLEQECKAASERVAWLEREREELQRERDWLREQEGGRDERLRWLTGEVERHQKDALWGREQVAELSAGKDWLERANEALQKEQAALREERDWLASERDNLAREAAWLRSEREAVSAERDWLREELEGRARELDWRRTQAQRAESERDSSQAEALERARELERLRALVAQREHGLAAAEARLSDLDRVQRERLAALEQEFAREAARAAGLELELAQLSRRLVRLGGNAAKDGPFLARLEGLLGELAWRRREMRAAGQESRRAAVRPLLLRTRLGRRAEAWREAKGDFGPLDGGEVAH